MGISDMIDGIMKRNTRFDFDPAEQRLQENMKESGGGPEKGGISRKIKPPNNRARLVDGFVFLNGGGGGN